MGWDLVTKRRGEQVGWGVRTGDNGVTTPAELLRAQGQNQVLRGRLKDVLGSSIPETIAVTLTLRLHSES